MQQNWWFFTLHKRRLYYYYIIEDEKFLLNNLSFKTSKRESVMAKLTIFYRQIFLGGRKFCFIILFWKSVYLQHDLMPYISLTCPRITALWAELFYSWYKLWNYLQLCLKHVCSNVKLYFCILPKRSSERLFLGFLFRVLIF